MTVQFLVRETSSRFLNTQVDFLLGHARNGPRRKWVELLLFSRDSVFHEKFSMCGLSDSLPRMLYHVLAWTLMTCGRNLILCENNVKKLAILILWHFFYINPGLPCKDDTCHSYLDSDVLARDTSLMFIHGIC